MTFETNFRKTAVLGGLIALMSACSHAPATQEFSDTASPSDEVKRLDADLTTALGNQVNVLAPHNFAGAQDSLMDAKKDLDKQKDSKDVLHEVAEGRAYLDRANQVAQLSHTNMEDVVTARQQAVSAGAPTFFTSDFQKADNDLKSVTSDLEKNETGSAAKNRTELQEKYLNLELKAIKQARLGQARDNIVEAKKEGAKSLAPRSLAIAEKDLKDSDAFITANRHDTDQLNIRAAAALESSNHLLKITQDAKSGKKTSPEEIALRMENEQNKVADKQGELALSQAQVDQKQAQIENKQAQLEHKQNQLTDEQIAGAMLTEKNQKLQNEEAFNRSFDEARAEFTQSEAQVYKQGNTLIIRLRGLEFPNNQAVLKDSNFPLLAKVQKVIKDFGKSNIVVEGHTDSNGGKALNEKLSTERAAAVKDYLATNSGSQPVSYSSIGYDYQKPLASNKTASGRAQNRRVDVLIERTQDPQSPPVNSKTEVKTE